MVHYTSAVQWLRCIILYILLSSAHLKALNIPNETDTWKFTYVDTSSVATIELSTYTTTTTLQITESDIYQSFEITTYPQDMSSDVTSEPNIIMVTTMDTDYITKLDQEHVTPLQISIDTMVDLQPTESDIYPQVETTTYTKEKSSDGKSEPNVVMVTSTDYVYVATIELSTYTTTTTLQITESDIYPSFEITTYPQDMSSDVTSEPNIIMVTTMDTDYITKLEQEHVTPLQISIDTMVDLQPTESDVYPQVETTTYTKEQSSDGKSEPNVVMVTSTDYVYEEYLDMNHAFVPVFPAITEATQHINISDIIDLSIVKAIDKGENTVGKENMQEKVDRLFPGAELKQCLSLVKSSIIRYFNATQENIALEQRYYIVDGAPLVYYLIATIGADEGEIEGAYSTYASMCQLTDKVSFKAITID